jgi:signal transduction histidine kinase
LTQRVNLSELIQAVTSMLTPRLRQEQREIITPTETNLHVLVDPLRLRQVLTNLLTNAINYSPGGTPIEIRVTLQRPASAPALLASKALQVYIGIHDQGIGIPADQQARLFEPFVRLEAARALAARGTGLGLFLSRQLLTSMGGSIWIESAGTAGEGTTMWISVPLANEAG